MSEHKLFVSRRAAERRKMAKRKGSSSASRPRTRSKPAKEGSKAKTDHDKREVEDEFGQIRCEVRALQEKRIKLSKRARELEEQKRLVLRELEQVERNLLSRTRRIDENENAKRLDKLPQEVWVRIFDNLDENDLFPLAMSCNFFNQKQKELVALYRNIKLRTNLKERLDKEEPASADYLRFCLKEETDPYHFEDKETCVEDLAAFCGHLPILQKLIELPLEERRIPLLAGES